MGDVRSAAGALAASRGSGGSSSERRSTLLIVGATALVILTIAVLVTVLVLRQERREDRLEADAAQLSRGVETFPGLTQRHIETPVTYPQTPPVGGDHSAIWLNCGIYTRPVSDTQAVHSLEHGAVWITYRPELSPDQVGRLTSVAQQNGYALVSPHAGLTNAVTVSAWGRQLKLDDAWDVRLSAFVQAFSQGPQTPEPGAPCSGGADADSAIPTPSLAASQIR